MDKLPTELCFEIQKFLKNKYGTFTMFSLVNKCDKQIKFNDLEISYICTSLELLKWFLKYFGTNVCPEKSFLDKFLELFNLYNTQTKKSFENVKLNTCIFKYVALNGNLNNMKWLKKNKCGYNERTFENAAKCGILKNMKWLKKNNCPIDKFTFVYVIDSGLLKNMIQNNKNNFPLEQLKEIILKKTSLKNIKWLKDNYPFYIIESDMYHRPSGTHSMYQIDNRHLIFLNV